MISHYSKTLYISCKPPMWEPWLTLRPGMRNLPFTKDPPKKENVISCLTEKCISSHFFGGLWQNADMGCSCAVYISRPPLVCFLLFPFLYVQLQIFLFEVGCDRPALLSALHLRCSSPPCPSPTLPRPCPAATWRAPSRSWRGGSTSQVIWSASLTEALRLVSSSLHCCWQNVVVSTRDQFCTFFWCHLK